MDYGNIVLQPEQEQLLSSLVEAARSVRGTNRAKFILLEVMGGPLIKHLGLPESFIRAYKGDVEILGHNGLLLLSFNKSGSLIFDVMPEGFRYYEDLKRRQGRPLERVQSTLREYITTGNFAADHPSAYQKWSEAEELLWSTDSERQTSTVGHLCREAVQEFATSLVLKYLPQDVDSDKAHHKARLKAVFAKEYDRLGKTLGPFLDALINYWDKLNDLIQRLEHANKKADRPVTWEDARLVVFQTLNAMIEIDRALSRPTHLDTGG